MGRVMFFFFFLGTVQVVRAATDCPEESCDARVKCSEGCMRVKLAVAPRTGQRLLY